MPSESEFRIAVLISGGGTTLNNLLEKIEQKKLDAKIVMVVSSRRDAPGIKFAAAAGIPVEVVDHNDHSDIHSFSHAVFEHCRSASVDLVVMGGFLKRVLIPAAFEYRVINIHPSLIPDFCGHGFYGKRVHQAVLDSGTHSTGCTVHYVDDQYDHGPIIEQVKVPVQPADTAESLAARVFEFECELLPKVINDLAHERAGPPT